MEWKQLGFGFKDKIFYKTLLAIAAPIALQNLISSSLNMVDTMMLGKLGELEIAAVGLANQFFFLFVLLLFGLNSGASIFIAQFWGKEDIVNIRKIMGVTLISGAVISLVFAIGGFFAPRLILRIFIDNPMVINLGSQYLRIVAFSYITTMISFAYSFGARSIGQAKLPMIVSGISLITNTVLNYVLIFGHLGFPPMGVQGAAFATLISRSMEMILLLWNIYYQEHPLAVKISDILKLSKDFVSKFFYTTAPVILNEGFWSLGMTMYMMAYARIGAEAVASIQIANTVQSIFMVISFGLGNACTVMIGNQIGADDRQRAIDYSIKFSILGPIAGIVIGLLIFLSSPIILEVFHVSPESKANAFKILTVMSFTMAVRVFNTILIVGILRGGGDTKFSLFLEMASVWLIGVPLAFLGAILWKLPIYWVVALVSFEEVVKALVGIPRVVSQKWIRNIVEQMQ